MIDLDRSLYHTRPPVYADVKALTTTIEVARSWRGALSASACAPWSCRAPAARGHRPRKKGLPTASRRQAVNGGSRATRCSSW